MLGVVVGLGLDTVRFALQTVDDRRITCGAPVVLVFTVFMVRLWRWLAHLCSLRLSASGGCEPAVTASSPRDRHEPQRRCRDASRRRFFPWLVIVHSRPPDAASSIC